MLPIPGFATVLHSSNRPFTMLMVMLTASVATAQGPIIGPQIRVDVDGGTAAANETTAAASEFNPNVIVAAWNDYREAQPKETSPVRMGVARSFDGGQTWEDLIIRPPEGFQTLFEGDPMAAFDDRTGTLWVGAIAFSSYLFVARLNPGETEFEIPVITAMQGGMDKCWMAAGQRVGEPDSTRVYITLSWGIQWSDDMGDTWSSFHSLGNGLGFLPRVGPHGTIYVVHNAKLRRSLNNGQSFTTHDIAVQMDPWGTYDSSRFPGTFRVPNLWYFDVSQKTGNLYVVYMDTTNIVHKQKNVDLYFTKSTDQGTTWTTPVVINGDNDPPGDQFFPWLELDGEDRIHVVFLDSRNTVQNDNVAQGMIDAYYTYSDDDGATWNEYRLTPNSWNSYNDGLSSSQQFIGDYMGMAVAGNRVYPMYVDTTGGDPDIYTNVIVFPIDGDLNGDGVVNTSDLLLLFSNWGPCVVCNLPGDCPADLNGDCTVNTSDLLLLFSYWG